MSMPVDSTVYLGVKSGIDPEAMIGDLRKAQQEGRRSTRRSM